MWHDEETFAEHFTLNSWHRWPKPVPWWAYGILLSLGLSVGSIILSAYKPA